METAMIAEIERGAEVKDEEFVPTVRRPPPQKPLRGVVRVTRATHKQISLGIAWDVYPALGWKSGTLLSVFLGAGKMAGKVRLTTTKGTKEKGSAVKAWKPERALALTVKISISQIGAREDDFAPFNAPFHVGESTLTVDLSTIMETSNA